MLQLCYKYVTSTATWIRTKNTRSKIWGVASYTIAVWRKEQDLNLRYSFPYSSLAVRCLRPNSAIFPGVTRRSWTVTSWTTTKRSTIEPVPQFLVLESNQPCRRPLIYSQLSHLVIYEDYDRWISTHLLDLFGQSAFPYFTLSTIILSEYMLLNVCWFILWTLQLAYRTNRKIRTFNTQLRKLLLFRWAILVWSR